MHRTLLNMILIKWENNLFKEIQLKNKFYNFNLQAESSVGYKHTTYSKTLMSSQRQGGDNPAAVSVILIDLQYSKVYNLSTIKEAASIIGCSIDNVQ